MVPRKRWSDADLEAMISLYLDGELSPADQAAVEGYLAAHPESAAARLHEAARLIDALDEAVAAPPVDERFDRAVAEQIAALGRRGRRRERLSLVSPLAVVRLATEAVLLLFLGALLWLHPWAPTVSPIECQLLGDSSWLLGRPAAVRLLVRDRATAAPLANAPVRLRLWQSHWRETLYSGRTNDQGAVDASFALPDDLEPGRYVLVADVAGPRGSAVVSGAVQLERRARLDLVPLSVCVPVGRPLAVQVAARDLGSGAPLSRPELRWRLEDAGRTTLAAGTTTLSDHGLGTLEVPTSTALPPGPASLLLAVGGQTARHAVLLQPALDDGLAIEIEPDRPYVSAGARFGATVTVRGRDGLPVESARCRAKLWLQGRVSVASGWTDAGGVWEVSLPAPAGDAARAWAELAVEAEQAGEVGTERLRLPAARAPLRLAAEPVGGRFVPGIENLLLVTAEYPDGTAYDGPARVTVEQASQSSRHEIELRGGEALVRWTPVTAPASARIEATLDGRRLSRTMALPAAPADEGLLILPARRRVSPGDAVRVELRAPRAVQAAYLDLVADGRIVSTSSLSLTGRRGSVVLQIPAAPARTLSLRAYAARYDRGWRTARFEFIVAPRGGLRLTAALDPEAPDSLLVTARDLDDQPVRAEVAVALLPAGARTPLLGEAPPTPAGRFTLSVNSTRLAHERALSAQRRFFARAPLFSSLAGGLLVLCALLWCRQRLSDPFEQVYRAERRAWGELPAVHRRGTWAGYGVLAGGLALAVALAGGVALAGRQARALAALATAPAPVYEPYPAPPAGRQAELLQAGLRLASPPAAGGGSPAATFVAATDEKGIARIELPGDGRRYQVVARALDAAGAAGEAATSIVAPARLSAELRAPAALRVGDQLHLPLEVDNPTDAPQALRIDSVATDGLELATAPTQRVVAPPRRRSRFAIPVRAAEPGRGSLSAEITGREVELSQRASIDITPRAPRLSEARSLLAGGHDELDFELPAGAVAPRLTVEIDPEPLHLADRALAGVAERPVFGLLEAAAALEAASLRVRIPRDAGRDAPPLEPVATAYQRLLGYQARAAGGFSEQPGGAPSKLATARALAALVSASRVYPVDERLLARTANWLAARHHAHNGTWLPDLPAGDEAADEVLRATAQATIALAAADREQPALETARTHLTEALPAAGDVYALALGLVALRAAGAEPEELREPLDRLAAFAQPREAGVSWLTAAATPTGATGRGAALETTALAVRALAAGRERRHREAAQAGADWLLAQQSTDGTWGAAATTVAVVRALSALGDPPASARGLLLVELDGQRLGRATISSGDQPLELVAAPEPGSHRLAVRFIGRGRAYVRAAWSHSRSVAEPNQSGLSAAVAFSAKSVPPNGRLTATLTVRNTGDRAVPAVAARFPVPAGFEPVKGGASLLELAVGDLAPGQARAVQVTLRANATAAGIAPAPATVYATYNPARRAEVAVPPVAIL